MGYPQTEAMLGECMLFYGQELGATSEFGTMRFSETVLDLCPSLKQMFETPAELLKLLQLVVFELSASFYCIFVILETLALTLLLFFCMVVLSLASRSGGALMAVGGALQQVSQAKDILDVSIKQTFIDPLHELQRSEMKEIKLKKVNGRRLDFDYKKGRRGKVAAEELHLAWDKFITSKELAERSMFVLLQSDVDWIGQLDALIAALLDYHCNAQRILLGLQADLQARLTAASNKPARRFRSKKIQVGDDHNGTVGFYHQLSAAAPRSSADCGLVLNQPCCRAMYSFMPNREGELDFNEGDIIILTGQVDSNWYEGTLGDRSGLLPVSYVDVLVPLPLP
ncbi:hypothetical protein GOODEAATRI_019023 [Goodea atripinnis]|uniref:SH3 domain-containing protein n=1 Tax=Goodea atripinnis TaxID=208336 RepID=A0ABV0NVT8_9TELE